MGNTLEMYYFVVFWKRVLISLEEEIMYSAERIRGKRLFQPQCGKRSLCKKAKKAMIEVQGKPGRIRKKFDTSFYKQKRYASMFIATYSQF